MNEVESWAISVKAVTEALYQVRRLPRSLALEVARALAAAGYREGSREGALLAQRAEDLLRELEDETVRTIAVDPPRE